MDLSRRDLAPLSKGYILIERYIWGHLVYTSDTTVTRAILIAFAYISMANLYCLHDDTKATAHTFAKIDRSERSDSQRELSPAVRRGEVSSRRPPFFTIGITGADAHPYLLVKTELCPIFRVARLFSLSELSATRF